MRQLAAFEGHPLQSGGVSVWMGTSSIVLGVILVIAGLVRYRKNRLQLDEGGFQPAGLLLDLVTLFTVLFGLALAAYLTYVERSVG